MCERGMRQRPSPLFHMQTYQSEIKGLIGREAELIHSIYGENIPTQLAPAPERTQARYVLFPALQGNHVGGR